MEDRIYEKFMLSVQGALLGKVTPGLRAAIVGWSGHDFIKLKFVVDHPPTELDYDLLDDAIAEIIADYPKINVETTCECSDALPKDLIGDYNAIAFLRYEA